MNTISELTVATCLALAAGAALAQPPVVYNQMQHVPLGNAMLSVSPDGKLLRASQLGPSGEDGFRTLLPDHADAWRGKFIVDLKEGNTMRFDPISQGTRIAPLEVTASATGLSALVEFTSSQNTVYTIRIKEAGDLVAVWNCVPGGDCTPPDDPEPPTGGPGGGGVIIDFEPLPGPDIEEPTLFGEDFNQDNQGNCVHNLRMTDNTSIHVNGRHLGDGDQVVVIERSRERQGRYPYAGFDTMEVRSSASQMVFVDEASR